MHFPYGGCAGDLAYLGWIRNGRFAFRKGKSDWRSARQSTHAMVRGRLYEGNGGGTRVVASCELLIPGGLIEGFLVVLALSQVVAAITRESAERGFVSLGLLLLAALCGWAGRKVLTTDGPEALAYLRSVLSEEHEGD